MEINSIKSQCESHKQKKKKIINFVLLLVNLAIVASIFIYYSKTSGLVGFKELFSQNIEYKFLIFALVACALAIVIETFRIFQLIGKSTGKYKFFLSLKTHMIGRYYDCITPFSAGGQPFQIFYLHKKGLPGDKATSIPLAKHFFSMFAFSIISIFVLVSNIFVPFTNNPLILVIAILALIVNGGIVALILLLSISKRVGSIIVIKVLKLLNKMHIIKNYKKTFFKVARFVRNYQKSMKAYSKSVFTIIFQLALSVVSYVLIYSITYFIYLAFLPLNSSIIEEVSLLNVVACSVICDLCACIMPLPGGSGLAEISFDNLFKRLFNLKIFPWALLIWRILTFFIFILVGAVQIVCSFIKNVTQKTISKTMSKVKRKPK